MGNRNHIYSVILVILRNHESACAVNQLQGKETPEKNPEITKESPPAQTKHNTRGKPHKGIYRSCMGGNQQIAAAGGTLKPHVLAYHCARSTSKRFPPPAGNGEGGALLISVQQPEA